MKNEERGTLEASGVGRVQVAPDVATVRLTVITEAKTAAEAATNNATVMQVIITAVRLLPTRSVSTSGLGVQPISTWDPDTRTSTITGYRAENGVVVETAVEDAAKVFDVGIAAGANQSSGISFGLAEERPHREEALRIAVKEAHADASVVATTADLKLLAPTKIEVDPAAAPVVRSMELARAEVATPVQPEALTITARVRMVFEYESQ